MKALKLTLLSLLVASALVVPGTLFAQGFDLVFCGIDNNEDGRIDQEEQCDYNDLVTLANRLINALIIISTFLATAAFAYAGILLLTSGGNVQAKEKAKTIGLKVLKGYLWILVAWLLVYTIMSTLLDDEYTNLLGR